MSGAFFHIFCVLSQSVMSKSCNPMTLAPTGSSVHWDCPRKNTGLPFLLPGDLLDPDTEPMSPVLADEVFTAELPGKSLYIFKCMEKVSKETYIKLVTVVLSGKRVEQYTW